MLLQSFLQNIKKCDRHVIGARDQRVSI